MNRIDYINKINTYAARFVLEVEGFNATNLYDINIHAESFLIPVLNEVFGVRLENLNNTKRNFPAIDLADFTNRVAFQLTSTSSFEKIKNTLEKFKNHNLDNHFDILYIYIITHKKDQYSDEKLKSYLPQNFTFTTGENIIDKDDLLKKISAISSTPRLQAIAKIYEHDFSDFQISMRAQSYVNGCLNTDSELISPNLLPISFPSHIYKAELDIDKDQVLSDLNSFLTSIGKKTVIRVRPGKLVKNALKKLEVKSGEWVLYEKSLYTFQNLEEQGNPFRKIVDCGTITKLECREYYESNENTMRVFKNLLRNTMIELCKLREIEWYAPKNVFRFANKRIAPNQKRIKWKGKKEATKTVISEIMNKKEKHIICFRNLAFKCSFFNIDQKWYIVLNPTWSFTNPGGYDASRFESSYISGLKRLENNSTVYNFFRFFSYYFSFKDLFTPSYPFLEIHPNNKLTISPRLEDKAWISVKTTEKKEVEDIEITMDTELSDNTLF